MPSLSTPACVGAALLALLLLSSTSNASAPPIHPDPPAPMPATFAGSGSPLPADWCGTPQAGDDLANEAGPISLPKIKVVEAVPSDEAPYPGFANVIQRHVGEIIGQLETESGGLKSLRFDLGTSCGPQYVDIQTVRLPLTAAQYENPCNGGQFAPDVHDELGRPHPENRNYLVYAPTVDCVGAAGLGEPTGDDRPGPDNRGNTGGRLAMVFYPDAIMSTALHELGHVLGAVQPSAPHHDGTQHCWDMDDVMCYPYTAFAPQSAVRPCDAEEPEYPTFDCGKDDYFNPEPAAGSYLDTHWNIFNSVFMCPAKTCTPGTNTPPEAAFSRTPENAQRGQTVRFVSQSSDSEGGVEETWEFGDGTAPQSGREVEHAYSQPGRYLVRLTVTDEHGATAVGTQAVDIAAQPPPSPPSGEPPRQPRTSDPLPAKPRTSEPRKLAVGLTPLGGLRARIACSAACEGTLQLRVSPATAKRLGLQSGILAERKFALGAQGERVLKLRLSARVRRALRRAGRVRGTLVADLKDATGARTVRTAKLRLTA